MQNRLSPILNPVLDLHDLYLALGDTPKQRQALGDTPKQRQENYRAMVAARIKEKGSSGF